MEKTVKNESLVKVDYTGSLEDGSVFDSSVGKAPLEFKVGEGKLIKGFEDGILGMKEGEEKEITLEPKEAYGDRVEQLIQNVPKEAFPKDLELKEGMTLTLKDPNGHTLLAHVKEIADTEIKLDLNHPLAGKKLIFKIKVLSIE